jgi:hypothetical protein
MFVSVFAGNHAVIVDITIGSTPFTTGIRDGSLVVTVRSFAHHSHRIFATQVAREQPEKSASAESAPDAASWLCPKKKTFI